MTLHLSLYLTKTPVKSQNLSGQESLATIIELFRLEKTFKITECNH